MRKKGSSQHGGKSIKTFFIYTICVVLFLGVALSIKAFFIIRESKFDGHEHFTVAFIKQNTTVQLIGFSPNKSSLSVLQIHGNLLPTDLGKVLGIIPDAIIESKGDVSYGSDAKATMTTIALSYNNVKTKLTIFDILRLMIFAKNVPGNNISVKSVSFPQTSDRLDSLIASLFTDDLISQDNVSIQIINTTGVLGLGQKFERILVNMGCNVISVSSSQKQYPATHIEYFGAQTYTLHKMTKLLDIPLSQLTMQPVANIVITIGNDYHSKLKL